MELSLEEKNIIINNMVDKEFTKSDTNVDLTISFLTKSLCDCFFRQSYKLL